MKTLQNTWKAFLQFLESVQLLHTTLDDVLAKMFYAGVLVTAIVLMLPEERPFEYSNLTVNSIATEEIIAPFKFAIQKTERELKRERDQAREAVPPVYDRNPDNEFIEKNKLSQFFVDLQVFFKAHDLSPDANTRTVQRQEAAVDSFLASFNLRYNVKFTRDNLRDLYVVYEQKQLSDLAASLSGGLAQVYRQGILDHTKDKVVESDIIAVEDGIEEKIPTGEVLDVREAKQQIDKLLRERYEGNALVQETGQYLAASFLTPNLVFNEPVTSERKEKAVHDVPITRGYVEQNERIIDSNEKVTEEVYQKLSSLAVAQQERSSSQRGWQQFKFISGKLLFGLMLILFTVLYLYFYRRSIFNDNRLLGMITIIFLMHFALAYVIKNFTSWPPETIPIVVAPMMLAMLLDFGTAFISGVSLSLILGSVLGNDYTFTFMSLIVGSVAIFSVQKIRNRKQMYRAILYITIAYLGVTSIFGLLHFKAMQDIFSNFVYYQATNAILAPTVVFLLIGIFEKLFDVTTDITLLELSDLNHPLIKDLSVKAPGSFNHSIAVANLAEAAALAIRANALLTRVGSYFHDIGKMLKPEYFVENQMGGINKHDNLSPHMSCLILINHVKEGAKLADKHNLPQSVRQFITEHHGTSLISYFYHKALEASEEKDLNESDFRYPGPKPQTTETAICMLADTVEAASRAMQNPTPQRIRNLVDTLVEKKIKEGQLDHCDLTMKQISLIKEAFIPILTGIHHLRIEYPSDSDIERERKAARDKVAGNTRNAARKKSESAIPEKSAPETASKPAGEDVPLNNESVSGTPGAEAKDADIAAPGNGHAGVESPLKEQSGTADTDNR